MSTFLQFVMSVLAVLGSWSFLAGVCCKSKHSNARIRYGSFMLGLACFAAAEVEWARIQIASAYVGYGWEDYVLVYGFVIGAWALILSAIFVTD